MKEADQTICPGEQESVGLEENGHIIKDHAAFRTWQSRPGWQKPEGKKWFEKQWRGEQVFRK